MADDHLRQLERRYRETRTSEDLQAWLGARQRAGELDPARLALAARLGDPAASALSGVVEAGELFQAVRNESQEVSLRVGLAVLRRLPAEACLEGVQDANYDLGEWMAEQAEGLQRLPGWLAAGEAQGRLEQACATCLRVRRELVEALDAWREHDPEVPGQVQGWVWAVEDRLRVSGEARHQAVVELFGQLIEILPSAVDVIGPVEQIEGERLLHVLREEADALDGAGELGRSLIAVLRGEGDALQEGLAVCGTVHGHEVVRRFAREEVVPWALGLAR